MREERAESVVAGESCREGEEQDWREERAESVVVGKGDAGASEGRRNGRE